MEPTQLLGILIPILSVMLLLILILVALYLVIKVKTKQMNKDLQDFKESVQIDLTEINSDIKKIREKVMSE